MRQIDPNEFKLYTVKWCDDDLYRINWDQPVQTFADNELIVIEILGDDRSYEVDLMWYGTRIDGIVYMSDFPYHIDCDEEPMFHDLVEKIGAFRALEFMEL